MQKIYLIGVLLITATLVIVFILIFKSIFYFTVPVVGPSPEQPVNFSHKQHSGEYGMNCFYCHRYANISRAAGVPDMELCVSCHRFISPEKSEVKKLLAYWDRKEPIPWIKVHDLPDFVYFPHKTHVRAGIYCDSCHGDVTSMERIKRVEHLGMRWCLDCHREKGVGIDCLQCHY